MMESTRNSSESLLVDHDDGQVLQCPPTGVVSRRYIDTHPFAELFVGGTETFVVIGPDAVQVAGGAGGSDYVLYKVTDEQPVGFLRVTREA